MRYEERFILRQREWWPDGKTDFLILSREIKLGLSNAAEVKRARSFLALQSVTDGSYYSLQSTKCYYTSRAGGTSRSAPLRVRSDWRSVRFGETIRAPSDGTQGCQLCVCVSRPAPRWFPWTIKFMNPYYKFPCQSSRSFFAIALKVFDREGGSAED
jgi:hypothetical protein